MKKTKFTPYNYLEFLIKRVGVPIEYVTTDKYEVKLKEAFDNCPGLMSEPYCWDALTKGWDTQEYDDFYDKMLDKYEHFDTLIDVISEVQWDLEEI